MYTIDKKKYHNKKRINETFQKTYSIDVEKLEYFGRDTKKYICIYTMYRVCACMQ